MSYTDLLPIKVSDPVMRALTNIEQEALGLLSHHGGALLVTRIPDKTETDCLGTRTPGRATYRRLEKLDLVYETEEDLMFPDEPSMGYWTSSIELSAAGEAYLAAQAHA